MKGGQVLSSMMRSASKIAVSSGALACETLLSKEHTSYCESNEKPQRTVSSAEGLPALSETSENPQNPALLVALAGSPLAKKDLENFRRKGEAESHVKEKSFPQIYNMDLQERLKLFLQTTAKVEEKLWDVEISSGGTLGQSGAIPKERAAELTVQHAPSNEPTPTESLVLLRCQSARQDGISLVEAFVDLCDEAEELKEELEQESDNNKRRLKALAWWQRLASLLHSLYEYSVSSLRAFLHYWKFHLNHSDQVLDPFQQMEMLDDTETEGTPGLSWLQVASVEEAEEIAESLLSSRDEEGTVNDVIVSCVSAAIARQVQEHQMHWEIDDTKPNNLIIPPTIHAMVPTYDDSKGGSFKEDLTLTRAPVPCDVTSTAAERLERVHDSLHHHRVPTMLGASSKKAPAAAFMVLNTPGPRRTLHMKGRPIEVLQGFAPLPPGVAVGVVASTYGGKLSLSVTAQPWAVPDPERFLRWVLEEYKLLYTQSPVALKAN